MTKIDRALRKTLLECLKLRDGESLLIIVDSKNRELGQRVYQTALRINKNTLLVETPACKDLEEPTPALGHIMRHVNANLVITEHQLYHAEALKSACHHGARIICLTRVTLPLLERTVNANLDFIVEKSNRIADLLSIGKTAHVTTKAGTDLLVPINRYKAFANTGVVDEPGMLAVLPAGEATIPPAKRRAEGIIIVDGSLGALGKVAHPIELRVRDGYLKKINGNESAQLLRKIMRSCGPAARNLAEFGIGTNPNAQITGSSIEDEKVLGTVHFAFGDAAYEGGRVKKPCHIDTVITKPTVTIDGHAIVQNGELLV